MMQFTENPQPFNLQMFKEYQNDPEMVLIRLAGRTRKRACLEFIQLEQSQLVCLGFKETYSRD